MAKRTAASSSAVRPRPALAAPSAAETAFFRHLVANMRSGVLAIDTAGAVVLMNGEARRIFGIAPEAVVAGDRFSVVLAAHPDIVRMLSAVFDVDALPNRAELRLKSSGTVIGYSLSLVRDDGGTVVGASLFFKDLTIVEQMEEKERLRDRLAAVGEMAAVMAHEIKNPLGAIEVLAGLLRRQAPSSPEAQALVGDIIGEAKMANGIVQEVLDFVRPVRLQVDPVSVSEAVSNAVTLAGSLRPPGGIALELSMPASLPNIDADRTQLTQVFANLVINAYEALQGRGVVRIEGRLAQTAESGALVPNGYDPIDTVIVDIADDGPGIAAEVAAKMFDPFFTTKVKGSGLGLAIVRKIVDAHEGRIDVASQVGQGTRFRVTLPVARS
jgi:PAS domain S-box-containing protein